MAMKKCVHDVMIFKVLNPFFEYSLFHFFFPSLVSNKFTKYLVIIQVIFISNVGILPENSGSFFFKPSVSTHYVPDHRHVICKGLLLIKWIINT